MRILVTGGAGFIGSTVADTYIQAGHRVWIIDNESTGNRANVNPKARYTKLDICDQKKVRRFFVGKRFDVVNHHAAQIDVRRSVSDPVFDAQTNIIGLLNLLEEGRKNRVRKFIFSSSGGTIYGECPRPATEKNAERPLSPYGVAKLASEKYILAYADLFGLRFTILRYGNVYGPRQDPHGEAGVVAIFSGRFITGAPVTIFGTGQQVRDYVYVGDVARANLLALRRANNNLINIGTGRPASVRQLYREMARFFPHAKPPQFKPARVGELARSVLEIRKAKAVLGWEPRTSLREGLKQTIRFFQSQSR